jgi:myo-inositol-1(or 4)-monophosphatase
LALATALAAAAGTLVREGRTAGVHDVETKTSRTDLVTEYDRAAERLIVDGILAARPDDGIVGEEGSHRPGTSGIDWLIDPIDGTTNFFYDLAPYAVSVAASDAEGSMAGVVHVPPLGETFTATRGGGAFLGNERLHTRPHPDPSTALVATGFGYDPVRRAQQGAAVAALLPLVRDIRRLGAASVDLCHVACGRVDAYYERGLNPWDMAAGALVAGEAGCELGNFSGGLPHHDEMLACAPELYGPLSALLTQVGA